jgi:hypothetical protein
MGLTHAPELNAMAFAKSVEDHTVEKLSIA